MDLFEYRDGQLHCEEVAVSRIAEEIGTPCYVYSASTFLGHYQRIAEAFAELDPLICYSVKCNGNVHLLRLLAKAGAGFDVVSGGELFRAIQAGGDPSKMVYAGVGKTDAEINQALDVGLGAFNIESEAELENIRSIAAARRIPARALLRVNPDVDPKTHRYTTTGKKQTKFGVDIEEAQRIFTAHAGDKYLRLSGVHIHLGSPINTIDPYVEGIRKVLDLIERLRGEGVAIDTVDIGGGFGADYQSEQAPLGKVYAEAIVPLLKGRGLRVIMEPGRAIAGNSGILVTRVLYLKRSGEKQFVVVDAGMNDLIRPTLYEAFHFIWPVEVAAGMVPSRRVEKPEIEGLSKYDVVGPICETGDRFAADRSMPAVNRGDLLAIFTAGAYGFTMSSQYNARPRAAEVLCEGKLMRLIRRRETYQDLVAAEIME
ncbi:MAG: diaminopimelate decarboxylase [Phycisphaerae bacterium]|nr:diaminopimelate decarboxylase [Phycisphaerae bacterium]